MKNILVFILLTLSLHSHAAVTETVFADLVAQALQADPEYANKKQDLEIANTQYTAANAAFLPTLELSASQNQIGRYFDNQPLNYQSYALTSNFNIFKFGADVATRSSYSSLLSSKESALNEYKIQFEKSFTESLLNYIAINRYSAIKNEQLKSQKRLLEIATQRFKQGYLAKQEVDKMRIDLEFIENEISNLQEQQSQVLINLKKQLKNIPEDLPWPWLKSIESFQSKNFNLEDHPSYLVRFYATESFKSDYQRSSRQFWGSLDLKMQWSESNEVDDDFTPQAGTYLVLTIPLFNRMQDWAERKVSFAKSVQADNSLEAIRRSLRSEYEGALQIFENRKQTYRKRNVTLTTSRALLSDNQSRFQKGRISANDLSIDQNRVFQAEQVAIEALLNAHLAFKDLCAASGKTQSQCTASK